MPWDEFAFQQQFSLEIGQLHKRSQTRGKKSGGALANLAYASLLSAVRTLRKVPGLPKAIQAAGAFLGTLPTPVKLAIGMVVLWWAGAIAGILAGTLVP